jgi:hypothetical protein
MNLYFYIMIGKEVVIEFESPLGGMMIEIFTKYALNQGYIEKIEDTSSWASIGYSRHGGKQSGYLPMILVPDTWEKLRFPRGVRRPKRYGAFDDDRKLVHSFYSKTPEEGLDTFYSFCISKGYDQLLVAEFIREGYSLTNGEYGLHFGAI